MAKFKVTISDSETGKSSSVEVDGNRALPLLSRRIGENIDGTIVGLSKHKLLITGGSDKDGFPMRSDVHGGVKSKSLLGRGVGQQSREQGERKRKMIRGDTITDEIVQINMKILEKPQKTKMDKEEKQEKKTAKAKPEEKTEP